MNAMKVRQGRPSFCEQKEAKKLPTLLPGTRASGQELIESFFGSFCSQKELLLSGIYA
jgi:hypothetical protein